MGLNAGQDRGSEMLVKLRVDPGEKGCGVEGKTRWKISKWQKNSVQEQWTEKGTKALRNQGFKEEELLESAAGASGASGPKAFDFW